MMKRMLILVLLGVGLTSCVAMGRKVDQDTLADLQPGQTTCADLRARYGPPTSSTIVSGQGKQLVYTYSQAQFNPTSFVPVVGAFLRSQHSEMTTVTFACNVHDVLEGYTATQGQDTVGTGFISGGKQK